MSSQSSGTSRAEPLARCWARETHSSEYWPAELLAITPDGEYQVAFCGWGERHNLVLPATAADGTPSVLFQQPARPRKKPTALELEAVTPPRTVKRKRPLTTPSPPPPLPRPQPTPEADRCDSQPRRLPPDTAPALPQDRIVLKIPVPSDLVCAACGGGGSGRVMLRCAGGCGDWVHRRCVGLTDAAVHKRTPRPPFACPLCQPPPVWVEPPDDDELPAVALPVNETALALRAAASPGQPATGASRAVSDAGHTEDEEARALLRACEGDRLMESDLRKHLRRYGLPIGHRTAADLPGELRDRLSCYLRERLNAAPRAPTDDYEAEESAAGTVAATEPEQEEERASSADSEAPGSSLALPPSPKCAVCDAARPRRSSSDRTSGRGGGVGGCTLASARHWCEDCEAIATAVTKASALMLGWASPELCRNADALRDAARRVRPDALAAISECAAAAAQRERRAWFARGWEVPGPVAMARAYWVARQTADRLIAGLEERPDAAAATRAAAARATAEEVGLCRAALESGGGELFFLTMGFIDDTLTLRAVACTCHAWSTLFDRSHSADAAAVWRRAWLHAPRGRLTLSAAIRSTRPGDRLKILAGAHPGPVELPHPLIVEGEEGTTLTGPVTLGWNGGGGGGGSGSGIPRGVLRRLRMEHFYETAVTVGGGTWALDECVIVSSRAPSRACAGVVLRGRANVELHGGRITGCSSAVLLSSPHARLVARGVCFANARSTVEAYRGGEVDVERCTFSLALNDVGMRVADDTRGVVKGNRVDGRGGMFGRLLPPPRVDYSADPGPDADAAPLAGVDDDAMSAAGWDHAV